MNEFSVPKRWAMPNMGQPTVDSTVAVAQVYNNGVAKCTSPVLEPYRGTVGGRSHARLCQWNDVHGHVSPMEDVH